MNYLRKSQVLSYWRKNWGEEGWWPLCGRTGTLECNKIFRKHKHQITGIWEKKNKFQLKIQSLRHTNCSHCWSTSELLSNQIFQYPFLPISHFFSPQPSSPHPFLCQKNNFLRDFDVTASAPAGATYRIRTFKPIHKIYMTKTEVEFQSFQLVQHKI